MVSIDEFVERLCLIGADRGPRRFPRRPRDRAIMMKSITLLMDSARDYDEAQINALIRRWKRDVAPAIETDHVSVRRLLVDRGQLERSADGRVYRVGFPPGPMAFDLEIDELDLVATITAYRDHVSRERERREAEHAEGRPERS